MSARRTVYANWAVALVLIGVFGLLAVGYVVRVEYLRSHRAAAARAELARDFPGFSLTQMVFSNKAWNLDQLPSDGYWYLISLRSVPRFTVTGDLVYDSSFVLQDKYSVRATAFDGRQLGPAELASLAKAWLRARGDEAVLSGANSNSGTSAARSLEAEALISSQRSDPSTMRRVAQRLRLGDTFGFESATTQQMYWFLLDRKTAQWSAVGTTDDLLRRYGSP